MDRRVFARLDSTNAEAARIADTLAGPTWILALDQTAGHGRRGRAWSSGAGNFAATLVMRPDGAVQTHALRSFVAALAVFDAVAAVLGQARGLSLKWPNDVLLNGGKLAGILLESAGRGGALAVGIGVNLAHAPDPADLPPGAVPPVSLAGETGLAPTPEAFLTPLASAFARYDAQLVAFGFGPIRNAWLDRAAKLGQPITARTQTEEVTGTFETVDETGALVLTVPSGRRAIPAADVFF